MNSGAIQLECEHLPGCPPQESEMADLDHYRPMSGTLMPPASINHTRQGIRAVYHCSAQWNIPANRVLSRETPSCLMLPMTGEDWSAEPVLQLRDSKTETSSPHSDPSGA